MKAMIDSNAQCQLLSSKILLYFLQKHKTYEIDYKLIIKNVIEKIMGINREEMQNVGL